MISIHLMLLFNLNHRSRQSRHVYFNTSNVTIQLMCGKFKCGNDHYFNTSNVTIQQKNLLTIHALCSNFNTSNVTIQPFPLPFLTSCYCISIHLMLLFNRHVQYFVMDLETNFNTSNVTIQPN